MSNPPESPERFSLSRWSRRKHEVAREKKEAPAEPAPAPNPAAVATPVAAPAPASEAPPLPPVESLTIDSDFRAFMGPKVDEETKRAALKKLFSDPHFNVMDGLDIYIGDYTKSDPMPEGMLAKIADVYNKLAEEGAAKPEAEAAAEGGASVAAAEESAPPAPPHEESPSDAAAEEDHDRRG